MTKLSESLINRTLKYFYKYYNNSFVVKPSLPILYFGDLDAYFKSDLKVITVGKNPSNNEFKIKKDDEYSYIRFPYWDPEKNNLIESLNSYFEMKPLKQWFSSFEPILNGMYSSFYSGKYKNRAIHTDICSPLATFPTWSKLNSGEQAILFEKGFKIWKQLVEELQPDVMLVSVPFKLLKLLVNDNGEELISFNTKKDGTLRKKPYQVLKYNYLLESGKVVRIIYGQAANKPFDTISREYKLKIGNLCQN